MLANQANNWFNRISPSNRGGDVISAAALNVRIRRWFRSQDSTVNLQLEMRHSVWSRESDVVLVEGRLPRLTIGVKFTDFRPSSRSRGLLLH